MRPYAPIARRPLRELPAADSALRSVRDGGSHGHQGYAGQRRNLRHFRDPALRVPRARILRGPATAWGPDASRTRHTAVAQHPSLAGRTRLDRLLGQSGIGQRHREMLRQRLLEHRDQAPLFVRGPVLSRASRPGWTLQLTFDLAFGTTGDGSVVLAQDVARAPLLPRSGSQARSVPALGVGPWLASVHGARLVVGAQRVATELLAAMCGPPRVGKATSRRRCGSRSRSAQRFSSWRCVNVLEPRRTRAPGSVSPATLALRTGHVRKYRAARMFSTSAALHRSL